MTTAKSTRPFLKWAGNKYRLLNHILPLLPEGKRLIEPFAGSAAVFLNTNYSQNILGEMNEDLFNIYTHLQAEPGQFIDQTRKWFKSKYNEKAAYYRLREQFNQTADPFLRATLFVYMNRHGFNGLCRYNQKGYFNVPFGRYQQPHFPEQQLLHFAEKVKQAKLLKADFRQTFMKVRPGDVVYCDPPYVPLSSTSNFTQYQQVPFGQDAQEDLATLAEQAVRKGATVMISNHDTPYVRKLYESATKYTFAVQRSISCNGAKRVKVKEILAVYQP